MRKRLAALLFLCSLVTLASVAELVNECSVNATVDLMIGFAIGFQMVSTAILWATYDD